MIFWITHMMEQLTWVSNDHDFDELCRPVSLSWAGDFETSQKQHLRYHSSVSWSENIWFSTPQ